MVIATQNPVEYEGTYPLPEAQLDRFLVKLNVPLPGRDEEFGMLHRHADGFDPRDLAGAGVTAVAGAAQLAAGRAAARTVTIAPEVLELHRRPVSGHPQLAVGVARCIAARCDCVAADVARVGVVVGPRLRDS